MYPTALVLTCLPSFFLLVRLSFGFNYKRVGLTTETTSGDVIKEALIKFNMMPEDPNKFELVQVLMHKGVTEKRLAK